MHLEVFAASHEVSVCAQETTTGPPTQPGPSTAGVFPDNRTYKKRCWWCNPVSARGVHPACFEVDYDVDADGDIDLEDWAVISVALTECRGPVCQGDYLWWR